LKAFEEHHRLSSCKHDPMFAKRWCVTAIEHWHWLQNHAYQRISLVKSWGWTEWCILRTEHSLQFALSSSIYTCLHWMCTGWQAFQTAALSNYHAGTTHLWVRYASDCSIVIIPHGFVQVCLHLVYLSCDPFTDESLIKIVPLSYKSDNLTVGTCCTTYVSTISA